MRDETADQIITRCRGTRGRIARGEQPHPLRAALAALADIELLAAAEIDNRQARDFRELGAFVFSMLPQTDADRDDDGLPTLSASDFLQEVLDYLEADNA